MGKTPPVLVTRSEPAASQTCIQLNRLGFEAINAATSQIIPVPVTLDLDHIAALAVTSPNGAAMLAARTSRRDLPIFAVGDATANALHKTGFNEIYSANGDVAELASLIKALKPKGSVLHVRGQDQAGDLCETLNREGVAAVSEIIYIAKPVATLPEPVWKALIDGGAILIHSAKGAQRLLELLENKAQASALISAPIIAMSALAAAPLLSIGAHDISLASTPDQPALINALHKRLG